MPSLNPTRQNAILLIVLLFVQLLMMTGDVRQSDGTTLLQKGTLRLSRPVVLLSSVIGGGMEGLVRGARELTGARRENARLRHENERLRAELDRAGEESLENARLRHLLDMKGYIAPRSVGASVVTANISSQEHVVVIDRGTDDDVLPDEPVIAWGGVVGRVVFADRHYAKVRLLSRGAGRAGSCWGEGAACSRWPTCRASPTSSPGTAS
jgi:rod shape-determining protein MreC